MRIVNIIFLITCTACVPDRFVNKSLIGGSYSVTKLKAKKSTHTIIAGKFLDYESRNRIIPATLNLNGVIHRTDSGYFSIEVLPGKYKLRGGFVGKKWFIVNLKLERGDSTYLNLYLTDDDSPLYQQ